MLGICCSTIIECIYSFHQADSGGALAWKNADGRFELFGLVSFGAGCASLFPGVYTDVFVYLDWIQSHINV